MGLTLPGGCGQVQGTAGLARPGPGQMSPIKCHMNSDEHLTGSKFLQTDI